MHWKATTVLICVYGIVKEFRPATPFLTPFLVSDKNLTKEVVYGDIYPYWTYSYFLLMIPIFFLTDVLRYRPIIILEAATLAGTWALLVWGQGERQMQLMQIIFGFSSAAEIAYYSYMYAMVDEKNYKRVSSHIRSSAMIGKLIAFSLAQFLVTTELGSYLLLNQISFAAVSLVTVIAFFLPSVPTVKVDQQIRVRAIGGSIRSKEEGKDEEQEPLSRNTVERTKMASGIRMYFSLTFRSLAIYRTSPAVLKWSVWWAASACGYYQIANYSQTLWISMQPDVDHVQNGICLIANSLMGATLSFCMQYLSIDWARWGGPTLAASSLLIATLQITAAFTDQIYLAYACYVGTSAIYNMLMTAASFNIASLLTCSNYGLVFGVNTFIALILQTALTFLIADSHGFNLDIRTQFFVYGCYFCMVSLVFVISSIVSIVSCNRSPSPISSTKMHWKLVTSLVCVYGIVKEFRPATPFLTPFLVSHKNLTKEVVNGEIYLYWTYAYFVFMIPIFVLTDILRYKPIIVLEASTLAATWVLLVWGQGVRQMQLMQICFGLSSASEVAYYSYIYAMVNEKNYKCVSSYIRSSAMTGKLVAFSLGQLLVSTGYGSYLLLNQASINFLDTVAINRQALQITFVAVSLVTVIALFLPSVPAVKVDQQVRVGVFDNPIPLKERANEYSSEDQEPLSRNAVERTKMESGIRMYFVLTFRSLSIYRTSPGVLKWSVWWALAACGYYQLANYSQTLWIALQADITKVQNGVVLIVSTLMGAILSFLLQYLSFDWARWGGPTLAIASLFIAALQITAAFTDRVFVAYSCYVCTSAIYKMLITAASFNIASLLTSSNYGVVFGVNTFVALILQTALTFIVADSRGLNIEIRTQFVIYGSYFCMVALIFIITIVISAVRKPTNQPPKTVEQ